MKRGLKWAALLAVTALLLLLALGWQRDLDPADLQAKYANGASQFLDIGGGLLVHVRDEGKGDGEPLVLLHGSNASLQTWEPWVKRLGAHYRVISLDQIGHGLTGPNPKDDYSAAAYVDTLDRVLVKLGVRRFALAGNSMGGAVAWHYALAHPEKVDALILVDAAGAPDIGSTATPIGFRLGRMPLVNRVVRFIMPRRLVEKTLRQSLSNQSVIDDKMIDRYWELMLYPGNRRATSLRFATANAPASKAELVRLQMPVLLLWGEEDTLVPVAAGRWFAQVIPQSRLVVYPGIGHIPMEEAPDQTARDVDRFLTRLAPLQQK